jgi:hypothetical protein
MLFTIRLDWFSIPGWASCADPRSVTWFRSASFVVCGEFAESLRDPLKRDATAHVIHRVAQSREIARGRFEWRRVFRHGAPAVRALRIERISTSYFMTMRLVREIPQVRARDAYQGIAHTIVQ